MEWKPAVRSHNIHSYRWSNKHPVDIIENLVSPHIEPQDSRDLLPGVLIAHNGSDIIYASSENTVTVLLKLTGPELISSETGEKTDVARDVALLPNITHVQVFETQLSVTGISVGCNNTVIICTMYHVILLRKIFGKYEKQLLHESDEHVLSTFEGHDKSIYILTISTISVSGEEGEITPLIDVSDLWRVVPVGRVTFTQYKQWFVVVETSAIHFVNKTDLHTSCTIPTEYLEFTEKFLSAVIIEDKLITVTSSYLVVYDIWTELSLLSLDVKLKISHNVADAHFAQFYPRKELESDISFCTNNFEFSVMSDQKCSFFKLEDSPDTDLITFIIPYKFVKLKAIQMEVLDKSSYLNLTVDKRNNITQRINSGICGASFSRNSGSHFLLNKNKDLFSDEPLLNDPYSKEASWNSWLSSISLEEEYWVENHPVDVAYDSLLKQGLVTTRSQTLEDGPCKRVYGPRGRTKHDRAIPTSQARDLQDSDLTNSVLLRPVPTTQDPVLEGVKDKYVNFLLDAWDWT